MHGSLTLFLGKDKSVHPKTGTSQSCKDVSSHILELCPGLPVPVATMMMTALGSSGSSSTFPVGPAHVHKRICLLFVSRRQGC